jgi:hypothetical protein
MNYVRAGALSEELLGMESKVIPARARIPIGTTWSIVIAGLEDRDIPIIGYVDEPVGLVDSP